ncbi:MAG: hypothetical protein QG635_2054 [Bacteroidota bacterium]|nr:hypothetical protein [Bacteroidota bacterium]
MLCENIMKIYSRNRINRERKTLEKMFRIFCREHHSGKPICDDCRKLLDYAFMRLDKCPFGVDKPVCNVCTVHCYRTEERELVREIMKYSGPRMMRSAPYLALMHLIDKRIEPRKLKKG